MKKKEENPALEPKNRKPVSGQESSAPSAFLDLGEIEDLIDLITEKGLSEFELEQSGVRIRIARNAGWSGEESFYSAESISQGAENAAELAGPPARGAASPKSAGASDSGTAHLEELFVVRSPMVGTFYAAPGQEAEPFVQVGQRIQAGQALCIIEAMKLMNEIEAEVAGEVLKCYVENGQPVEYGEPLFDLRPLTPFKRSS